MSFDDATIMAYVDGELDALTARRLEKAMQADPALAERVAAERALRARIGGAYAPLLDATVPDSMAALLGNVDTSLAERRERRDPAPGRRWGVAQLGAMAASLVIGVLVGPTILGAGGGGGPVRQQGDTLVASGALADALETQLASANGPDKAVRIGLTYRDRNGALCRTFDGAALGGIACRADGAWQLRWTRSGKAAQDYRQAGSGEINAIAAEMMAGQPVDAAGEADLMKNGWKSPRP